MIFTWRHSSDVVLQRLRLHSDDPTGSLHVVNNFPAIFEIRGNPLEIKSNQTNKMKQKTNNDD